MTAKVYACNLHTNHSWQDCGIAAYVHTHNVVLTTFIEYCIRIHTYILTATHWLSVLIIIVAILIGHSIITLYASNGLGVAPPSILI